MGEIAQDMIEGFCCSRCGIYFEEAHHQPVICRTCLKTGDESKKELGRLGISIAYHKELGA